MQPVNLITNSGDEASFNCSASGGPSNLFRWIRTSAVNLQQLTESGDPFSSDMFLHGLNEYVIQNGSMLTITSVNATEHGGQYSCVVVNEAGYDDDTITLNVRPNILENPESQRVVPGVNITLSCRAESFPPPEYRWERLNNTDMFETVPDSNASTLELNTVEHDDNGIYRCVATAPGVDGEAFSSNATITGELL